MCKKTCLILTLFILGDTSYVNIELYNLKSMFLSKLHFPPFIYIWNAA